uniref:Uncharacterized protein n=1 Tax=Timema monikensis TaxID=170555 RepID=A0A7R9EI54_9NEOP|nr:unnamed protein product [Timema monikensis]
MSQREGCEGIIQDAILLGTPVTGNPADWDKLMRVVSGKLVNGYCSGDWLLKFLYRTLSVASNVAGLQPIQCKNRRMCNVDLSELVGGQKHQSQHNRGKTHASGSALPLVLIIPLIIPTGMISSPHCSACLSPFCPTIFEELWSLRFHLDCHSEYPEKIEIILKVVGVRTREDMQDLESRLKKSSSELPGSVQNKISLLSLRPSKSDNSLHRIFDDSSCEQSESTSEDSLVPITTCDYSHTGSPTLSSTDYQSALISNEGSVESDTLLGSDASWVEPQWKPGQVQTRYEILFNNFGIGSGQLAPSWTFCAIT